MRKIIFTVLSFAAMFVFAVSCDEQSDSLKFQNIITERFEKHPKVSKENVGLKFYINFTYPSDYDNKAVLEILQRKFITFVIGEEYSSLTVEDAVDKYFEDVKKGFLEEKDDFLEDVEEEISDLLFSRGLHYRDSILFVSDKLLQMRVERDFYGGGYHGFGGSSSHLFNIKTGEEYDHAHVFKPVTATEMEKIILPELLKFWNVQSESEISFEKEKIWNNDTEFAITNEGIMIAYSDYELGAINLGRPSFIIPYVKILPYLRTGTPIYQLANKIAKDN